MATVALLPSQDAELARVKAEARRRAKAARLAIPPPARAEASERLRAHVLAWLKQWPGAAVAGFWPLGGEVDLKPLLRAWHEAGGVALLPRMQGEAQPLRFLRWTPATVLQRGTFDVDEPPGEAPEHRPDIILVPLLAVDRDGYRLGYGGGYYDRTLAVLEPRFAVGVGFDAQRVDRVPRGVHDHPLTHLATESGVLTFPVGPDR